jgi:DNA-binding transcriptional LysR family regulator
MQTSFVLVCSKSYVDKFSLLTNIGELQNHKYLSFRPMESQLKEKGATVKSILRTDSLPMLLKMALNGDGITVLPDFISQQYIDTKELIRIVPSWSSKSEVSHILYPPTKNLSKKVKAFIEVAQSIYD